MRWFFYYTIFINMILLKSLLSEQNQINVPNVLFIGDEQTASRSSFANRLISSKQVTGNVVGRYNIDTIEIYRLLKRKLNKKYNAVVIMVGPNQIQAKSLNQNLRQLDNLVRLGKVHGAKVILVIAPLTKVKTDLDVKDIDKIQSVLSVNTQADDVIDIGDINQTDIGVKTRLLNSNIQSQITDAVTASLNDLLQTNIVTPEESEDELTDTDDIEAGPVPANAAEFINMWKATAIDQMNTFGIPASITLAQGGLESGWGRSYLSKKGNNYFGIKCHSWSGEKIYADDDHPNECFRKYKDASESFNDHSLFLKNNGRYAKLFKLDKTDFEGWANGLQSAGYATSQTYATKLIKIIKSYGLDNYDTGNASAGNDKTNDKDFSNDANLTKILKSPLDIIDLSGASTYKRKNEPLENDKYFIVHHTAGRGGATGVMNTLNGRGLGVQWVVDREGKIYRMLPAGHRGAHIRSSKLGPNNSNSQGVEVIAKDDSDVLPVQAAAVLKLVKALGYSPNQIYGHGEVNSHKQASEGQTIKQYILKNYSK
jgi:flagellum-specific peptidoglycan hydrolase FlgJ